MLDGTNVAYYPGQTVNGRVVLELEREIKIRGRYIPLHEDIVFSTYDNSSIWAGFLDRI